MANKVKLILLFLINIFQGISFVIILYSVITGGMLYGARLEVMLLSFVLLEFYTLGISYNHYSFIKEINSHKSACIYYLMLFLMLLINWIFQFSDMEYKYVRCFLSDYLLTLFLPMVMTINCMVNILNYKNKSLFYRKEMFNATHYNILMIVLFLFGASLYFFKFFYFREFFVNKMEQVQISLIIFCIYNPVVVLSMLGIHEYFSRKRSIIITGYFITVAIILLLFVWPFR